MSHFRIRATKGPFPPRLKSGLLGVVRYDQASREPANMRQLNVTIALTVPILLAAGGCQITHVYTDVSEDPGYSPGGIVGRCFFLREGAYLLKAENQRPKDKYARLAAPGEGPYPPKSDFESGNWDRSRYRGADQIVAVVPAGTMVCIRKIVRDESLKDKPLEPVAAIIDGQQFMTEVLLSPMLVQGPDRLAHWTAVERFLVPLDKAVLATQRATTTQSVH